MTAFRPFRSAALAVCALALCLGACKPHAAGRCAVDGDCNAGAFCAAEGICLAASGTCVPACNPGEICNGGACVALRPVVTVQQPATPWLGPGHASVVVTVVSSPSLSLGSLTVLAQTSSWTAASGSVKTAVQGQNTVVLTSFTPGVQQQATLVAVLNFGDATGAVYTLESAGVAVGIDYLPPQLPPAATLATAGVPGEDGNTWFPGATAPVIVDLALLAVDNGSGVDIASAVLTLPGTDTKTGLNVLVPADSALGPDGALHFKVSTSVVAGREGKLHYSIVVKDRIGNTSTLGPSDALAIFVDDLPPSVQLATIQYATATPPFSAVCGRVESTGCTAGQTCGGRGFHCGRGPQSSPTRVLRDDAVTVTFTAVDCGSGVATGGATWAAESAANRSAPAAAAADGRTAAGGCAASANLSHELSFTLPVATAAPLLDPPHPDGTTRVRLGQDVLDRMGLHGRSTGLTAASPDGPGVAIVSLVRWSAQLGGLVVGAPALLPAQSGATSRVVVAANDFAGAPAGGTPNLFLFDPAGRELSSLTFDGGIAGDVAVGQKGTLYMPGALHGGGSEVEIAAAVDGGYGAGGGDGGLVVIGSCNAQSGSTLGAPVALTAPDPLYENVIAVATARTLGAPNLLAYQPNYSPTPTKCNQLATSMVVPFGAGELTGVSVLPLAGGSATFASHGAGFSSVALDGGTFSASVDYNNGGSTSSSLYAPAAPAIYLDGGVVDPIFGAYATSALDAGTGIVRNADAGTCGLLSSPCWTPGGLAKTLDVSHTPLFAGGYAFATDDAGRVQAFQLSGSAVAGPTAAASVKVSAPLLLGNAAPPGNQLVVVQADGRVRVVTLSPSLADALVLTVGSFAGRPPTPVADAHSAGSISGSVIYVIDGGGCVPGPCGPSWIWALQSDAPPLAASSTAWVRPGRDSCNTRNSQAACP